MNTSYQYLDDESLNTLLTTQRQNLVASELQAASYGPLDVPLKLNNQIRAIQNEIQDILTELNRRKLRVKESQEYLVYEARKIANTDSRTWSFLALNSNSAFRDNYTIAISEDEFLIFDIKSSTQENIGVNKSIKTLYGRVDFKYQVISSEVDGHNIVFCMIPMQEPGPGRSGLIEVGSNIQGDSRNPFSPYRTRLFIPKYHVADNQWHDSSIFFDFRHIPTAFYSIFGPRINEGCMYTGKAQLLVTSICVFSYGLA